MRAHAKPSKRRRSPNRQVALNPRPAPKRSLDRAYANKNKLKSAKPEAEPQTIERVRPFSEIRPRVWKAFLGAWLAFILAALFFLLGGTQGGRFQFGVVLAFAIMFFGAPLALMRIARRIKPMDAGRDVDAATGRFSQAEVLVQIVLLPAILAGGLVIIGLIASHQG
jgi:hypothetical protein